MAEKIDMSEHSEIIIAISALLSSLTALVAVFIGPVIASRLQKRLSVAAMREKWIHDFRQVLSELSEAPPVSA